MKMKHLKTTLLALSLLLAGSYAAKAQDIASEEYVAAKKAITNGGKYRIKTDINGTYYYVTTDGTLTNERSQSGLFTITQTTGGYFGTGFRISGTKRFTNPPLTGDNVANLTPGSFSTSSGNDRADWERQILYLKDDKYAIRSCNVQDGTSSWNDAGRTHWTWSVEPVTPCYSYDPAYVWEFERPKITYELYEGETKIGSKIVEQDENSAISIPSDYVKSYYNYTTEGSIGDTDCTIKVTRSFKSGVVLELSSLSNSKAYTIACDRGKFLTKDGWLASTAHSSLSSSDPTNFAIISYESHYYLYSIDDAKFVLNTGQLATMPTHGIYDAIIMEKKTSPYFLYTVKVNDETTHGLNTNGIDPYGYVINDYITPDAGNQYFMLEVADFDATDALAALETYFHPSYRVTYNVKDKNGSTLFTSEPQPTTAGTKITTLPVDYQRPFYTYNEVDVTISNTETTVDFTATWDGPFEISADYASAHWYDMAMRKTWYVTSAVKDGDAYKTQNANTMGLVEDSYQWAFIGNGYTGFKVINKAEGDGKSFGWTDENKKDQGIPTVMDDATGNHYWSIIPSTNTDVPDKSFCLNVPGTNLYINQYGGAGGSLKFWDNGRNIGDAGSAFTIFEVPSDFHEYVASEISPYIETTGYFALQDAKKSTIGYDDSYKTNCSFENYKSMKEKLSAIDLSDMNNYNLPETGYYRLKNTNYNKYMGLKANTVYGNYTGDDVTNAATVVKLTQGTDENEGKYSIQLQGKYLQGLSQSQNVPLADNAAWFSPAITKVGSGTFSVDEEQYTYIHCAGGGNVVGWTVDAGASQWALEDATSINVNISAAGYATLYVPFPVTVPTGVKAYAVGSLTGNLINLTEIEATIPAGTPVILEGEANTYTFAIANEVAAYAGSNELTGSFTEMAAPNGSYILQNQEGKVGFYEVDTEAAQPRIPANRAYLPALGGDVKAFYLGGGEDAIKSVFEGVAAGEVYDLSGRKVSKLQHGVNIVNGKKVIVK